MNNRARGSATAWSVAALAAAAGLGFYARSGAHPAVDQLAAVMKPVGELWMAALQGLVLPMVVANVFVAIVGARTRSLAGSLGARALALFVLMILTGAVLTPLVVSPVLARYPLDPDVAAQVRATVVVPDAVRAAAHGTSPGLETLLPRNVFEAAARGDLLALLAFTVLLAAATSTLPEEMRDALARVFKAAAEALLVAVRWIILLTPAGLFGLVFTFVRGAGWDAAGLMGFYMVLVSGTLLLFTALLYPVTALAGRVSMRAFASAVAPAQLVAAGTRSSIAALPAMVDEARRRLNLPATATGFVLPLSVAVFKVNRCISSTVGLLFIAHVFGTPIGFGTLAAFWLTILIVSFGTAGVAGGSGHTGLPAYLAAGVPIEGYLLLDAAHVIEDVFKTMLNVTADMSAAVLLSRSDRGAVQARAAARPARAEGSDA